MSSPPLARAGRRRQTAYACTGRRGTPQPAAPAARPPGGPGASRPRSGGGKVSPSTAALKKRAAPGRKNLACRLWASGGQPRCGRGGASGCRLTGPRARCWRSRTRSWPSGGSAQRGCSSAKTPGRGRHFATTPGKLYRRGVLTNPNMFLAGQIGRGKSALAKSFASRCSAFGRRVYVPGDPKGEWAVVSRALGGQVIELGPGRAARLNPLDEGPRPAEVDDAGWRVLVSQRRAGLLGALAEATLGRPLGPTERTALDAALAQATTTSSVPVLPSAVEALFEPRESWRGSSVAQLRTDGRNVAHALGRLVYGDLAGLFDGPSTTALDPALPMVSLDLSAISGSETLLGLVMTCASTWMEATLADPAGGQRLVVYDEAWRLMAQPSLLARMQAQWKLSRAWGLANLLVVHRLSDLDAVGDAGSEARGLAQGLLGDTATRVLYNEPYEEAQAAGRVLGLSSVEVAQLPGLARGEGLWRVNERSFVVRHLLTPGELALFSTDARMLAEPPL